MDDRRQDVSPLLPVLLRFEKTLSVFSMTAAWCLLPPLIGMRAYDIVAKQFIKTPAAFFQVLEFNAFYLLIVLTVGFTYLKDGHVRIDILRNRASPRTQAWLEIIGFFLALTPFAVVVIYWGGQAAWIAYEDGRRWLIPGIGYWVKKALLPFGVGLLYLVGLSFTLRNILFLCGRAESPAPDSKDDTA